MIDGKALKKGDLWEEFYLVLHQAYTAMRHAFKKSGLSQDEVAERLNINKALVSKRLKGKANLTLKSLSFMASAIDCRVQIVFVPYAEIGVGSEYHEWKCTLVSHSSDWLKSDHRRIFERELDFDWDELVTSTTDRLRGETIFVHCRSTGKRAAI